MDFLLEDKTPVIEARGSWMLPKPFLDLAQKNPSSRANR